MFKAQNWRQKSRSEIRKKEKSGISELILQENENLEVENTPKKWVHEVNDRMAIMTLADFFI